MADIYIDPSRGVNGVGTESDPKNSFPTLESSTRYLLKRGTKLVFEDVEYCLTTTGLTDVEFGAYGDSGEQPVISGEKSGEWVFDAMNGVWYSESFNTARGPGCVTENGDPLTWVKWDTSIEKTAAAMPTGSFSLNHTSSPKRLYAKPRSNDTASLLVASSWTAFYKARSPLGSIKIRDLTIKYFSGNSINIGGATESICSGLYIRFAGGFRNVSANFTGGAGIQIFDDSDGVDVFNCIIEDSFDSGVTAQSFVDNRAISNIKIFGNTIRRFALGGVEIATFNPGTRLNSILVFDNVIEGGGRGYSGLGDEPPGGENEVVPAGLFADFAASTASVSCVFARNIVRDSYYVGSIRGSNDNTRVQWIGNKGEANDYGFRLRCRAFGGGYGLNTLIASNVIVNTRYDEIVMSAQFGTSNNSVVVNNTFVNTGRRVVSQTYSVSPWVFANNVATTKYNDAVAVVISGASPMYGKNYLSGFGGLSDGMADPSGLITTDPLLGPTGRPLPGSPLIGAGANLGPLLDASSKRFRRAPSIGAYEYVRPRNSRI
jgi:hypothetical protein